MYIMIDKESDEKSGAERFGEFVSAAARQAGYEIDSPRGGGKTKLAKDTGMSLASVSRMLAGLTIPEPRFLEPLAEALGIRVEDLLVRSGLVSRRALASNSSASARRPLTVREAAADLGIEDPAVVEAFESMVKVMLSSQAHNRRQS